MSIYSVEFENVAVTASQDFFEIAPISDRPCLIHACYLSQSTETGDAEEEMLRVKIIRGHTTGGSGGSVPTPVALNANEGAADFSAEVNNTTIASGGTPVDVHSEAFNVRVGWVYVPTPEIRPLVTSSDGVIVVRLMANPIDSITMSGTLYVAEL